MNPTNSEVYISILLDTLQKKNTQLEKLVHLCKEQENLVAKESFDVDSFVVTMDKKQVILQELERLDEGFANVYQRVGEIIQGQKQQYKDTIQTMQKMIRQITEKTLEVQGLEQRNKARVEMAIRQQRHKIKSFKVSNKTASSYYKNMANQHMGQSYFMDRKK